MKLCIQTPMFEIQQSVKLVIFEKELFLITSLEYKFLHLMEIHIFFSVK